MTVATKRKTARPGNPRAKGKVEKAESERERSGTVFLAMRQERKVQADGRISYAGQRMNVGADLAGKTIEIVHLQNGIFYRRNGKLIKIPLSTSTGAQPNASAGTYTKIDRKLQERLIAPGIKPVVNRRIAGQSTSTITVGKTLASLWIAFIGDLATALSAMGQKLQEWSVYIDAVKTNQRMVDEADRRNGTAADEN